MQFSRWADDEDMFQSTLAAVRGQRQSQHSGCGGHNNYACTNLRQSVEIVETCLLIRGRLTLCTQYISSPLRIHQPLPSRRLAESIIAGHQATVTALFHSKRAFEPVRPIHQVGAVGFIWVITQRGGDTEPAHSSWLCSTLEVLAHSLSVLGYKHSCARAWSNIFKCLHLPGPLLHLISQWVAPGDLENCLKFTGTDQDVRMRFSCLPCRRFSVFIFFFPLTSMLNSKSCRLLLCFSSSLFECARGHEVSV